MIRGSRRRGGGCGRWGWGVRAVLVVVLADEIFSENVPLAPSLFFLSTSLADSFIYWGPCGSRNSFAVVLPLHTKRTKAGR